MNYNLSYNIPKIYNFLVYTNVIVMYINLKLLFRHIKKKTEIKWISCY